MTIDPIMQNSIKSCNRAEDVISRLSLSLLLLVAVVVGGACVLLATSAYDPALGGGGGMGLKTGADA